MNSPSSLVARAATLPPTAAGILDDHIRALYEQAQANQHLFASPLGPLAVGERQAWLPRFVFFGPNATDEAWRLAFLAGFDRRDRRASHALLNFIESLAERADAGYGLNLTFFPQVDFAGRKAARVNATHWARSADPVTRALERDARVRSYHGFIGVETAPAGDETLSIRVRAPAGLGSTPDVELISSEEVDPIPVRFERETCDALRHGPLSIAGELAVAPFELTLRVPAAWPDERYYYAVATILGRFVLRYRAFQAYGQHL